MAKKTSITAAPLRLAKPKKKRPGVHSKKQNSVNKTGKWWNKPSRGQGS